MNRKTLMVLGVIIVLLLIGILVLNKKNPASKITNDPNTRDFETTQTLDTRVSPTNVPAQINPITPTISNEPLSQDSTKNEITPTQSPTLTPTKISTPTFTPTPTLTIIPTLTPNPTLIPTNIPTATPTINSTVYPTGVSLSATLASLYPGDQQQIIAKVDPDNATDKNITWSSNDFRIAIVDSNGLVTAINPGITNIVAKTSNNKTTIVKIIVSPIENPIPTISRIEPDSINLNVKNVLLSPNKRQQITVNFSPKETNVKTITWSSNNSTVASVSNNGLITSIKPGTAIIVAKTPNGKTATANITVSGISTPTLTLTPTPTPTIKIITPTITNKPTATPTVNATPDSYFTSGLKSHIYKNNNQTMNYWLYIPSRTLKTTKMPLVIFLHGSGECGTNIKSLLSASTLPALLASGKNFNAIILSPQTPTNWSDKVGLTSMLIDYIVSNYNIDRKRISITGHSLGGHGALLMAANHPSYFSCVVPIAPANPPVTWASLLKTNNIWSFHGTADKNTSPAANKKLIDAIVKAGGNAKITLLQGKSHNIVNTVYIDYDMVNWMIEQKR